MPSNRWTRQQDLAVLYLRAQKPRQSDPRIAKLAQAMNRTPSAIWMRKGNFDALDPSIPGLGLSNASRLTERVWAEYEQNPQRTLAQGQAAYRNLLSGDTR